MVAVTAHLVKYGDRPMIRRLFRRMFKLALVLGGAAAVYKVVQARRPSPDLPPGDAWPPAPKPVPARPEPAADPVATATAAKAAAKDVAKDASAAAKGVAKDASAAAKDVAKDASAAAKDVAAKAKAAAAETQATVKAAANSAAKAAKVAPASGAPWVEPVDGACPPTHPVKAKLKSMIYHLPGMLAYDRTAPDRCYRDAEAAEADGLRKAKR